MWIRGGINKFSPAVSGVSKLDSGELGVNRYFSLKELFCRGKFARLFDMSITYQPKRRKRKRTHGFLKRSRTRNGQRVILRRRRKKREKLTV